MYKVEVMDTFENIANRYSLNKNHFYRYLQVRNYLKEKVQITSFGELHPLLRHMIKANQNQNLKNMTGQMYQVLQDNRAEDINNIKDKWQIELKTSISNDEWKQSLKDNFSNIKSPFWQEYAWKINIWYFRTPVMLSKYTQNNSSCWRECGEDKADHTHIFFTCKKIEIYWSEVIYTTEQIFEKSGQFNKHTLWLGIGVNGLQKEEEYLFWILRITALKQITRNWKKLEVPKVNKWLETVENIYRMERVTYRIKREKKLFEKRWARFKLILGIQ